LEYPGTPYVIGIGEPGHIPNIEILFTGDLSFTVC
jgi:hypothetical protein